MDPDVQQESDKMRARCRRYVISGSSGSGLDTLDGLDEASEDGRPEPGSGQGGAKATNSEAGPAAEGSPGSAKSSPKAGKGSPKKGRKAAAGGEALLHEAQQAQQGAQQAQQGARRYAVEMFGLRKVYRRGNLLRHRPFVAVRGNWLGIYEGGLVLAVRQMGPLGAPACIASWLAVEQQQAPCWNAVCLVGQRFAAANTASVHLWQLQG